MIALVTGATAGIGREIAAKLRAAGATVYLTGRDLQRGEAIAAEIGATFLPADHASLAGNLDLAQRMRRLTPYVEILVNNVGGMPGAQRTLTAEGHETTLALNYLGPAALTHALLPSMLDGGRIVQIVSSALSMHTGDPFTEPSPHRPLAAYARAKQLCLLATMSLARQLAGRIAVNAVNPGMAWTPGVQALTPQTVPAWRYIWPLVRAVQRRSRPEKAARLPTTLALRPPGSGHYYESSGKPKALPSRLRDAALHDLAWQIAIDATGHIPRPNGE